MFKIFRRHPSIKLNVLIYREGDNWIAHCLQMDIVAANTNVKTAEDDIIDLIKAQVTFALENDNLGNLFKPAPAEEWAKLENATKCGTKKIRIELEHDRKQAPINEVELCFA